MERFDIPLPDRLALAPYHREFQATVALVANTLMGRPGAALQGIGKYQGGIIVNGREIAIYRETVQEDWTRSSRTIPEETATANALHSVNGAFKTLGHRAFHMPGTTNLRDPLRSFFEPAGVKL